jgi:DNA-binding NtrC family response regulator
MTASPALILYVEDNAYVRESVTELLSEPDRQFIGTSTGQQARDVLATQSVRLLLTDVNLPDMSGIDLVREALKVRPDLPVIVCSAHDLSKMSDLLGPTVHALRKPFELDELEGLVDQLLPGSS